MPVREALTRLQAIGVVQMCRAAFLLGARAWG